jgi:hypothetical protein
MSKKPTTSISIYGNPDTVSDLTKVSSVAAENETNISSVANENDDSNGSSVNKGAKKGGQLEGSTTESKQLNSQNRQQALNYVSMEALKLKEAANKDGNPRVK